MSSTTHDHTLGDYVLLLWSRRYLLIAAIALAALLAFVLSSWAPPVYRATATLIISDAKMPVSGGAIRPDALLYANTFATLLKGEAVTSETIQALDLERTGGVSAAMLSRWLTVRAVPNTLLLTVSLDFPDSAAAARIVNTQTEKAVALTKTMATTDLADTRAYLQEQVGAAQRDLTEREAALLKVRSEVRFEEAEKWLEGLLEVRGQLELNLADAEQDAARSAATADSIRAALAGHDRVLTLTRSVVEDGALREAANAEKPRSPQEMLGLQMQVQQVNPLFEEAEPELLKAAAEAAGAGKRRDIVRKQLAANDAEVRRIERRLADATTKLKAAEREYDLAKTAYENFTKSFEDARLTVRAQIAELKLIAPAVPDPHPVGPRVLTNTAVAAFAAALLAAFAILAFDGIRRVRRAPAAVDEMAPSPSLQSAR